ncbi:MAG: glycosyltransferase, partial [Patescibacteria group bacterium]
MKILHITKKYPNALGGDTVVVSNLEKQQWKGGHKVAVLTSNCDEIQTKRHVYKFGLKDTPAALDNITPKRLLSLGHLFFKSFRVIRKERPDVIHTHSIDMAFAASFAARFYKVPMVHTFHILTFHDKNQSWLRRKTELLFKKGANPRIVTAPDQADIDHLRNAGVANAALLPNGIDLKFWHKDEALQNEVFTFISVSRLETQKGIEYLIKAAAILKQKSKKPFKILIVGDGSQLQELGILAMDLDISDNIELVGRKTPEELRDMYASSDAAVIPSLWESTPITLLEAWAMKLPVVCTPVGIVQGKTHEKDVALTPAQDEKALAKAMLGLLENPDSRKKLAARGYQAVQQYTWDKVYKTAEKIYDSLAKKEPAQPEQPVVPTEESPRKPFAFTGRDAMLGLAAASIASLATAPLLSGTLNMLITLPLAVLAPGLLLRFAAFRTLAGTSLAATASIATALGLLLTTVESLVINWLLPLFGTNEPLQAKYLVPTHLLLIMALLVMYLQRYGARAKDIPVRLRINRLQTIRFVVPLLLPLLAAAGAFRQNNGFGNEITVIALAAMASLAIWFVIKPKVLNPIWLLFNIALGLLLTTSLRSWFVSGFDISQEFQVLNLTLQNHHWDLNAIPGNAYNACL